MDYRTALTLKVEWEKQVKPNIKYELEREKDSLIKNIKSREEALGYIERATEMRPYLVEMEEKNTTTLQDDEKFENLMELLTANVSVEELDETIKTIRFRSQKGALTIQRSKYDVNCLSYLYNGDYEKAVKYYNRVKAKAHEIIDDADGIVKMGGLKIESNEMLTKEHGYNELCKNLKCRLECYEDFLQKLALINGDVKQVLKAGKRMNKRKNKKNKKDE